MGLGAALSACARPPARVEPTELLPYYARGELEAAHALLPDDARVEIPGLSFVDWAYPHPDRIAATQGDPAQWARVCARDRDGGPTHHGIKLALDEAGEAKLIAFLPYSQTRVVTLLKRAFLEGFSLRATVSWIGVLRGEVWDQDQRAEADMVALDLHTIRRM